MWLLILVKAEAMIFRFVLIFVAMLGAVDVGAAAPAASFAYTPERKLPLFEKGRSFSLKVEDIEVVGVDVGPEDGAPLVLVGGFSMSYPYMRKFIFALNDLGFRVFAYNPPGQGRRDLESGVSADSKNLGIDGMLKALPAMRNHAYLATGKRKVVVVGQSLGGLQVRAGSLGIVFDENGAARVSQSARRAAREQTALIVPLFSLPLYDERVWDMSTRFKATVLKDYLPTFLEIVTFIGSYLPNPLHIQNELIAALIQANQGRRFKGEFGAPDLDPEEVRALNFYLVPQKISRQIRTDLERWAMTRSFSTNSGLDFGAEWKAVQESSNPYPALYVGGELDSITDFEPFAEEARAQRTGRLVQLPVGHLGAFIDQKLPTQIATVVRHSYEHLQTGTCETWLIEAAAAPSPASSGKNR